MTLPAIISAERESTASSVDLSTHSGEPIPFGSPIQFPKLRDPRYPVHRIADRLEPYLRALVEKCQPERIILFGSYAYGRPNEHSDVDLLVVRKGILSRRESNLEIRRSFRGVDAINLPFTLLSETPADLDDKLTRGSHFYADIVTKGLELYRPDCEVGYKMEREYPRDPAQVPSPHPSGERVRERGAPVRRGSRSHGLDTMSAQLPRDIDPQAWQRASAAIF